MDEMEKRTETVREDIRDLVVKYGYSLTPEMLFERVNHLVIEPIYLTSEQVREEIAEYLAMRFVYGRDAEFNPLNYQGLSKNEKDSALRDASNISALLSTQVKAAEEKGREEEYARWIKAFMKAGFIISGADDVGDVVRAAEERERERIKDLLLDLLESSGKVGERSVKIKIEAVIQAI